jgi:hypothetical protein
MDMSFNKESEMSACLKELLNENLNSENIEIIEEFSGLFGIPDYLLVEKTESSLEYVIALELKLKNWNRALCQAFKYRTFSHESYVVMDEKCIENALKNIDKFINYNIGLASFNNIKEFKIYHTPEFKEPFSKYFLNKIQDRIVGNTEDRFIEKCFGNIALSKRFSDLATSY